MAKKLLSNWRVLKAEPSGLMVWFDPDQERLELHDLEPPGEAGVHDVHEGGEPEDI